RLFKRYVGELRNWSRVERHRTRMRLIDVSRGDQLCPFCTDVGQLDHARLAELLLQAQVPVLHVRRSEISLKGERRRRQWERELTRERIRKRQRGIKRLNEQPEIKQRWIEVEPLARSKRRLVVVDAVAGTQHRLARLVDQPREPNSR